MDVSTEPSAVAPGQTAFSGSLLWLTRRYRARSVLGHTVHAGHQPRLAAKTAGSWYIVVLPQPVFKS